MSTFMNKNKFLATFATASAVLMVATVPTASAATSGYKDVAPSYSDAVDFLVKNGITYGESANVFGTTNHIKRSDAAIFIARSIGVDENKKYKDAGFKDVPKRAQWAVNALVEKKILSGLTSSNFGSDDKLTRNQIAKIITNAGNLTVDDKVKKSQFKDVNSSFAAFVESLIKADITKGKTKDTFGSYDFVTRGELALFITRAQKHFGFMDLTVMHMNDSHAYLERFPYVATAVKQTRAEKKNNVLLHAGDVFSGDLYFNAFKGKADVELMNAMKFDAMTFGNHEFDLGGSKEGHKALADFVKSAKFPLLGANVNFAADPLFKGLQTRDVKADYKGGNIYNGVVLNVNGQKVGVFGLTTEETPTIASTGKVVFTNYITEAKKSVKSFEDMGINKVIAVTHIGYDDSLKFDNDLELAKKVKGIDVIVGGHTHSKLDKPTIINEFDAPTIIVQANDYGKALGVLDVSFNQYGNITSYLGKLINTDPDASEPTKLVPDKEILDLLTPYTTEVNKLKNQTIGKKASVVLDGGRDSSNEGKSSVRHSETNLGNLITDAMLAKSKEIKPETSIAIQNGGGIRTSIPVGEITVGGVLKVLPFGNPLAIMELSGAEIKATLEKSVDADTRTTGGLKENGAFLQVSGLKFTFDSSAKKGERVKTVQVKQGDKFVDLDAKKMYFVATNSFTAKGGDGYDVLSNAYKQGRVSEPGFSDYENLIDYMKSLPTVAPKVEGRIVDIAKTK